MKMQDIVSLQGMSAVDSLGKARLDGITDSRRRYSAKIEVAQTTDKVARSEDNSLDCSDLRRL
jgi:hypothetical protein